MYKSTSYENFFPIVDCKVTEVLAGFFALKILLYCTITRSQMGC